MPDHAHSAREPEASAREEAPTPELRAPRAFVGLALFSAITAIGGGAGLIAFPEGSPYLPPIELLAYSPFSSFRAPGVLLASVVGGTSLLAAVGALRRWRVAIDLALLAGGTLAVWIVAQVGIVRGIHWLHVVYGLLAAGMIAIGVASARRSPEPRHRWVVRVTAAETLGYLAPATAGILCTHHGVEGLSFASIMVLAGGIEGLALGTGQALAMPLPVRTGPYAGLTAAGAALVWASVMAAGAVGSSTTGGGARAAVAIAASGVVALLAIGSAQWIELRHHARGALTWIGFTALAWTLALPLSFAAGPFVDASTPLSSHFALWGSAGAVMAYVMALVTFQGVRRVARRSTGSS